MLWPITSRRRETAECVSALFVHVGPTTAARLIEPGLEAPHSCEGNYVLTITQLVMTNAILHRPDPFFPTTAWNHGAAVLGAAVARPLEEIRSGHEGDSDMSCQYYLSLETTTRAVTLPSPACTF